MRHALAVLAALALAPQASPPAGYLIVNGTIVDGTGAAPRSGAIRIKGDRIVEIGATLAAAGEEIVDAGGLVVAPGFIDAHSHADRGLDEHPDAASQLGQGITTAIVGQDGGSDLPVSDLFRRVESVRPTINYASLVGHGTVRRVVLGDDFARQATAGEIATMKALVDRGMRDGALGLSSGLEYDPGFYAAPQEVVELARAAAAHGGLYTSHLRDEENAVFDAIREAIDVGRQARLPVHVSHIKLASTRVWGRADEALRLLEDAEREGLRVSADWYPYTYWQSSIYVLIPDRDFENRAKWETGLEEIGGAGNVLITSYRADRSLEGRTVADAAAAAGTDPVTQIIGMIRKTGPGIGIIGTSMRDDDLGRFAAHRLVLICSDGGLTGRHPRGYGAFPRVLGRYVREQKAAPLHEMIARMTSRTAERFGLADRGALLPDRFADVVVFDPKTVADRGTPREPSLEPVGIRHVLVNGQIVLRDGRVTDARPGRALRRRRIE